MWGLWGNYYGEGNFKLAHDLYEESYQLNILQIFSNNLELDTKKEIHITTEDVNKDLWPTSEIKEAVQKGLFSFGCLYLEHLRKEDPIFEMDSIPFLATDYEQAQILWKVTRPYIESKFNQSGLVYLFSIPCSPQDLYLNKSMDNLSVLRVLKIRTYGKILPEYVSLLGMNPVLFKGPKEFKKLQEGQVDGFFGSRNSAFLSQTSIFASYYYRLKYSLPKYVVVMNIKDFEALSPDAKNNLFLQAKKMEMLAWRMSQTDDQRRQHLFKQLPIPEWFKKRSLEVTSTMIKDWKSRAGDLGQKLLDTYKNALIESGKPLPPALGGQIDS